MGNQQEKSSLDVREEEFTKTDDKQTTANSGVGDGVDFAESLPGGGNDNKSESSITAGESGKEFSHRMDDDKKS